MVIRLIFNPFSTQFSVDYRGLMLRVKAPLRLASLGLDKKHEPPKISLTIGFSNGKKISFLLPMLLNKVLPMSPNVQAL